MTDAELNCFCYIAILETIWLFVSRKCVYKSYLEYMYKDDLALNNLLGLIYHKNQLKL